MVGEAVGRFEIVREVASTSSGAVYKATDTKNGRTVALRTLSSALLGAADGSAAHARNVQQAMAQAKAASALNSLNLASIYGGGEKQGIFFVTMEWVEGLSLRAMLRDQHSFSGHELADIARQACLALDHAHSRGVFHHRLTPNNIVVGWDGTVKVTDLEIAEPSGAKRALPYLSPEQIEARPPDARSNLFSLAAILYELVSGQKAFPGDDVEEIGRHIYQESPAVPEGMNAELGRVLLKALAKAPAERYQSGAEFMADLEPALLRQAEPVAPPSASQVRSQLAATLAVNPAEKPAATLVRERIAAKTSAPITPFQVKPLAPPASAKAAPPPKEKKGTLWGMPWLPARPLAYGAGACVLLTMVVSATVLYPRVRTSAEAAPLVAEAPEPVTPAPAAAPPEPVVVRHAPKTRSAARSEPSPEATPAKPAPAGELIIESSPADARVEIAGRADLAGDTPLKIAALEAGAYTVRVWRGGYEAQSHRVEVAAQKKTLLAVTLVALPAVVTVNSDPAGARILVDGKDTGRITPGQVSLPAGSYIVSLRKPGFLDASRPVSLSPGESFTYAIPLQATGSAENIRRVGRLSKVLGGGEGARLQAKTNPKGAQVAINGRMLDGSTPAEFKLEPGTYQVRLTAPGHKPLEKTIAVGAGARVVLDEALSK